MVQAFNWLSHQGDYYGHICEMAPTFKRMGFTYVWLPPPTASVSPEGYMPTDYFNLSSRYGDEAGLRRAVAALKAEDIKVAGDCVLNHRCALHQDEQGVWNKVRAARCPTCSAFALYIYIYYTVLGADVRARPRSWRRLPRCLARRLVRFRIRASSGERGFALWLTSVAATACAPGSYGRTAST